MSFWVWYDYMGVWFIINLFFILPAIFLCLPLFSFPDDYSFLSYLLLSVIASMYIFFVNVFVSAFTAGIIEHKEGFKNKLIYTLKVILFRSPLVFILFLLIFGILFINLWFYAVKVIFNVMWINYVLIGFFFWLNLFTFLAVLWVIPSLAFKKMGFWRYVYWGYIILLANPYFSFQVLLCYTIFCILNVFPVYFFFIGMVFPSIFLTCAYEILSRKYEAFKTSGDKLADYQIFRDYEDEFLNRGWEHLIKPWKI